jgi:hypothetical protein
VGPKGGGTTRDIRDNGDIVSDPKFGVERLIMGDPQEAKCLLVGGILAA